MLKRFFLNALSAFVGAWAAFVLIFVAGVVLIIGLVASMAVNSSERLTRGSILKLSLSGVITENEDIPKFDYATLMTGKLDQPQSLKTIKAAIEKAATTGDVDALYIECGGVGADPATLNVIRECIKEFKKSGKRVVAYGDGFSMGDYFVATAADAIYLNPAGSLDIQGINGTSLYYKDLLDKIGIDVEMVKVGTYKSAVEPYISNEMSQPARAQLDTLYSQMWGYILESISQRSQIKPDKLNALVDSCLFLDPAQVAKDLKLVDDCLYERQVMDRLAEYVGKDVEDLNFVSPSFLAAGLPENPDAKRQIAVLYAIGDIGEYEGAGINCAQLVPVIVKLAEDKNVEGMVLRVNSPGGSVFGSEQIGEALDYFQSKGKPLAVSMGDYAASGGYWISAGADRIFADQLTITGSIGIFGLVPNVSRLTEMIGVHPQMVGTNPGSRFPSIFYPMTPYQKQALQKNIERGYEKFVKRVADGRHKTPEYIKSIAEGRVWSAFEAKKLGLVDELGGIQQAVEWTAKKADVKDYNIVSYPRIEPTFFNMLPMQMQASEDVKAVIERLKSQSLEERVVEFATWILMQRHEQARCPYVNIRF